MDNRMFNTWCSTVVNPGSYGARYEIGSIPKKESGVYALFDRYGKLLYIGVATDLLKRIKDHLYGIGNSSRFQPDIKVVKYVTQEMLGMVGIYDLEKLMIYYFSPPFNIRGKGFERQIV